MSDLADLAKKLIEADAAVRAHAPKSGPEFEAKVRAWEAAYRDLIAAKPRRRGAA